jgi:hypothetical protein
MDLVHFQQIQGLDTGSNLHSGLGFTEKTAAL